MNTDLEKTCPYAPPSNVLLLIRHARDKGLKEPVTSPLITTIGIPEGNTSRTLQAFRLLKLLDEEGYFTPTFKLLSNAPSDEYPDVLAQILKDAYDTVFMALDPAKASDQQFENAFRFYQPKAQRSRMIVFFKALCREAGLITGGAPDVIVRPRTNMHKSGKLSNPSNSVKRTQAEPKDIQSQPDFSQNPAQPTNQLLSAIPVTSTQEFVILQGLLNQLPFADKKWTQSRREKWVQAMTASVDLLFELVDPGMDQNMYS